MKFFSKLSNVFVFKGFIWSFSNSFSKLFVLHFSSKQYLQLNTTHKPSSMYFRTQRTVEDKGYNFDALVNLFVVCPRVSPLMFRVCLCVLVCRVLLWKTRQRRRRELFNSVFFLFFLGNCNFTSYFVHRIVHRRFRVISPQPNRKSHRSWEILGKNTLCETLKAPDGGAFRWIKLPKLLWENNCIWGRNFFPPKTNWNICCLLFTTKWSE